MSTPLKFFSFSSLVDTTFWHILSKKKLDELKLNDDPIPAVAFFRTDQAEGLPPLINFDYNSFKTDVCDADAQGNYWIDGDVIITNTLEDFKKRDKQQLITSSAKKTWDAITQEGDGKEVDDELNRFLLLTYLDLKKFVFYYWFAFPAFTWPESILQTSPTKKLRESLSPEEVSALETASQKADVRNRKYFLVCFKGKECTFTKINEFSCAKESSSRVIVAFADPSSSKDFPGWPLRNLLTFLAGRFRATDIEALSFRGRGNILDEGLLWNIRLEKKSDASTIPDVVGWEKNTKGKLLPRNVDMAPVLDPLKLVQNAVNLNLKLMRWRLIPELDLDKIAQTKCLILGSGTLGCNVARSLLAWGVETITFVDNSKVSFSNPVRQSLFNFDDCLNGGLPKAQAAAEALKKIYPNIKSVGHTISIPMPGHFVTAEGEQKAKESVNYLDELIRQHDCIFLLMDTRESRWLPTLLGQVHDKLVINAALGFDTFLVQRHGLRSLERRDGEQEDKSREASTSERRVGESVTVGSLPGSRLGCYFCNDVVAPGDSTRDRTLDQQCTVTRPGVSMMAAALAVELMVSVIQHPQGIDAPAATSPSAADSDDVLESCLGVVPHQIRGFLSRFTEVLPSTSAFVSCTACSHLVIDAYRLEGFSFLVRVFNDSNLLEELTGLKKLHEETNAEDVWALSDEDLDSERSSLS